MMQLRGFVGKHLRPTFRVANVLPSSRVCPQTCESELGAAPTAKQTAAPVTLEGVCPSCLELLWSGVLKR